MNLAAELRSAIARTLANEVKAYDLARACVRFGLADGTGEEAYASKMRYVDTRLEGKSPAELNRIVQVVILGG